MNTAEILKHVDHTLLKPVATWEDIQVICDEAIEIRQHLYVYQHAI